MSKIVRFHQTGGAEVLQLEDLPTPDPGEGEVRLQVEAIGLNRAEIMFREGKYLETPQLPSRLGYEAAGVIDAVGPGVSGLKVGDRISTIPAFSIARYGVYGETAVVPADAVAPYPDHLSAQEGAAIWMQYFTAWGALIEYGQLQAGDCVLITAASSSVGHAAIQIAKATGAFVVATTRTRAKQAMIRDRGADAVVVTDEEDLVARVMDLTSGRGADLIFDPIAGPMLETLTQAAAPRATLFEYGALSPKPTPFPLLSVLSKGLRVQGYTLFEVTTNAELRDRGQRYIYQGLQSGKLQPIIDRVFPLDRIVEAHRYMESNQQNGKIVVVV